jgi:hypothetical protein
MNGENKADEVEILLKQVCHLNNHHPHQDQQNVENQEKTPQKPANPNICSNTAP